MELGKGKVEGYDFQKEFNTKEFFESYKNIGFQATNLGKAIELVKKMQQDKVTIFLGFTSNITSSGLRDIITYLVKNKLVHFLVTTTGGVEEDVIKTHGPFLHGSFDTEGGYLRENGVNRTGNIFIPNERYIWFEGFMKEVIPNLYAKQKETTRIVDSVEFINKMGEVLSTKENHEEGNAILFNVAS